MSYATIAYEAAPVARIRLDRPEVRNAQSRQMLRELHDVFTMASADPDVRVILLTGNGKDFSSGHDVTEMTDGYVGAPVGVEDNWKRYERLRQTYADNHLAWRDLPKPTVAAVQGRCFWGGWMLASTMDIVFAADDAQFLPMPYPADYWALAFDVGPRKAKELAFEHRLLGAQEARSLGFVNRVLPAGELEARTLAYAERVAEQDPLMLRDTKHAINQAQDLMGYSTSVRASFASGAARHRPTGYRHYGQIGPHGMDDGEGQNPFARMVRRAVARPEENPI